MMQRFHAGFLVALSLLFLDSTQAQPAASTNSPPAAATNSAAADTNLDATLPHIPGKQYTNSIGMELLQVPGGYWAGKYEVTQKEYQKITGSNPSAFPGEQNPVDSVSYNDAVDFCQKLTAYDVKEKMLPEGFTYTLPTEDQWQSLVADASLADAVTSASAPRSGTSPVGSLNPNSLGLYDMRGNVMEFCLGDTSKPWRVLLGGSWQDRIEINLRLAFRNYCPPDEHKNTYGFRCILLPPPAK